MTAATASSAVSSRIPLAYVVALVPVAAALNIVGGTINTALRLPTFLDMIGTAVVAILLGPWWGALVGVIGNVGGAFFTGPVGVPFALVNVAGALVWGYGVRSLGMGASAARFFLLNIIVALVTSAIAAPIVVFVFGGATGHSSDALTAAFATAGQNLLAATLASSVIVSLADKIISGFLALAIIDALPPDLSRGIRLPAPTSTGRLAIAIVGAVIGAAFVIVYQVFLAPQPAPA
jgi:energy-coupling factor transport system substrate-specific component